MRFDLERTSISGWKKKYLSRKKLNMEIGYRIDIVVESKVLIEVKSIETLALAHFVQTLTHLKLSRLKLAFSLILMYILKGSIHRIVNNL